MRRRSPASEAERAPLTPAQARTLALGWLGLRDLSVAQLRQRLRRRGASPDVAEATVAYLVEIGALDETRLALAAARRETAVRGRGPVRARLALRALGLPDAIVDAALEQTLAQVDIDSLLDRAIEKRLRSVPAGPLDRATFRRVAGALVRQGFDGQAVMSRLRRRGAAPPDDEL